MKVFGEYMSKLVSDNSLYSYLDVKLYNADM